MTDITQEDLDALVEIADKDPKFKKDLQELDELAKERNVELKDIIKTAVDWYTATTKQKKNGL